VVQRAYETAKAAGREKLFPDVDVRGRQLTRYLLSEQVRSAVASLVEEGHTRFAGVHAYTSRHTFAVMALLGGATYQEVAQQLGHVTTAMVIKRYGPHAPARGRIAAAIDAHVGQQAAANGNALNPNGGVADALGPE
jgi:integrase